MQLLNEVERITNLQYLTTFEASDLLADLLCRHLHNRVANWAKEPYADRVRFRRFCRLSTGAKAATGNLRAGTKSRCEHC
jgi:hypothetical protein